MGDLQRELAEGKRLAAELVGHIGRMGGAASVTFPVSAVDESGRLCEWEVSVTLKGVIDPNAEPTLPAKRPP